MRTELLAAPALGLAVLVAACSGGGATRRRSRHRGRPDRGSGTRARSEAPASAPASEAPAAGGAATVNLADNALGKIVVDGAGKTLYVFTPDGAGGKSPAPATASSWPALESDGAPTLGQRPRRRGLQLVHP